ncbi:hypothetical protein DRQ25_18435, partial [Candidatus Fermentibacteria bacterium]
MSDIIGAGGGGEGSSHTPIEANDTLQSRQVVKLLLVISEGEIEDVEDIFLNKVSISNFSATWAWRAGTGTQTVMPGFINTEEPIGSFSPVTLTTGTEFVTAIPYDAQSCRITFTLSLLKQITEDNDTVGYTVQYNVYTRPSSAAVWTFYTTITKTGKSTGPYSWDTPIRAPAGVTVASSWEIKVIRTTIADDGKHFSPTQWSAATAIRESNLTYNNSALVSITLTDAQQFGGNIPEIAFKVKGIKVKIPDNYDAANHLYDET